jgi:PAS domain S-box-containing protein
MTQKLLDNRSHLYVQRVHDFFRRYHALAERDVTLSQAFSEIAVLLEVLQGYEQELARVHNQHQDAYAALDAERHYVAELFEAAPAVYFVLRLDGTLRRVNKMGRELLHCEERALVGRALTYFVAEGQRRAVQSLLNNMPQQNSVHSVDINIQPSSGGVITVQFAVSVARSPLGRAQELRMVGQLV